LNMTPKVHKAPKWTLDAAVLRSGTFNGWYDHKDSALVSGLLWPLWDWFVIPQVGLLQKWVWLHLSCTISQCDNFCQVMTQQEGPHQMKPLELSATRTVSKINFYTLEITQCVILTL
jgi:hypothetical protein